MGEEGRRKGKEDGNGCGLPEDHLATCRAAGSAKFWLLPVGSEWHQVRKELGKGWSFCGRSSHVLGTVTLLAAGLALGKLAQR